MADKLIALTFDDGPNEPYTSQLLEVLKRHGVRATFFVVGENVERSPETVRQVMDGGHVVGNHLYSHRFINYFLHPTMAAEMERTERAVERAAGRRPALLRTPWLFRQPLLISQTEKRGLTFVSGTFGHEFEFFQPKAERIARRALRKAASGRILIFHDGYNAKGGNRMETIKAIDILIPKLQERCYRFVTVDNLLGIPAYQ